MHLTNARVNYIEQHDDAQWLVNGKANTKSTTYLGTKAQTSPLQCRLPTQKGKLEVILKFNPHLMTWSPTRPQFVTIY